VSHLLTPTWSGSLELPKRLLVLVRSIALDTCVCFFQRIALAAFRRLLSHDFHISAGGLGEANIHDVLAGCFQGRFRCEYGVQARVVQDPAFCQVDDNLVLWNGINADLSLETHGGREEQGTFEFDDAESSSTFDCSI